MFKVVNLVEAELMDWWTGQFLESILIFSSEIKNQTFKIQSLKKKADFPNFCLMNNQGNKKTLNDSFLS